VELCDTGGLRLRDRGGCLCGGSRLDTEPLWCCVSRVHVRERWVSVHGKRRLGKIRKEGIGIALRFVFV
jgi:hypothetical protein